MEVAFRRRMIYYFPFSATDVVHEIDSSSCPRNHPSVAVQLCAAPIGGGGGCGSRGLLFLLVILSLLFLSLVFLILLLLLPVPVRIVRFLLPSLAVLILYRLHSPPGRSSSMI